MIEGYVEALRPFQVRGWVIDLGSPARRVNVRVGVNGRSVGKAVADLFRQDLASAHQGDGKHAFVANVYGDLPLHNPTKIVVEAELADGTWQTLPPVLGMVVERVNVQPSRYEAPSTIRGYFDATPDQVAGWACDLSRPDDHLDILIVIRGEEVAIVSADTFRADLVHVGIGSGDHGFSFKIPPFLENIQPMAISAIAMSDGKRFPLDRVDAGRADSFPAKTIAAIGPPFRSSFVDTEAAPVIVLGAARSGTSAMAQALTGSGAYAGFEEGHFLDLLAPLMQAVDTFYTHRAEEWAEGRSTHLKSVPRSFVEEGLRHVILEGARLSFPGGRWVDKTPRAGMVALAPALRSIWPKARFVYMRRRGIENLDSRLRKFPGIDFEAQCREWALSIQNWYAVADELTGAALEIDQMFLVSQPGTVAAELATFLGLSAQALERITQALTYDQPERTAFQFGAVVDPATLGWPDRYTEIFARICGPAMRQAGYGEGQAYFAGDSGSQGMIRH